MPSTPPQPFADAQQVLVTALAASGLLVPPERVAAWLRLAEAAGAVLGPEGQSHLPALLENDIRAHLHVDARTQAVVEDLDRIVRASRRAGWQGVDTPRAFAAAVATGEVAIMDKVVSLEGAPPPETWGTLVAPVLDREGNFSDDSPRLPAPQVWAAARDAEEFPIKALAWWLDRHGPVQEDICRHASPASLPLLLAAGAPCSATTAASWADVAMNEDGRLCLDDVACMLDQLSRIRPPSPEIVRLRTAIPGCRLVEDLATEQFGDTHVLARRIDGWRRECGLSPSAPLPSLPSRMRRPDGASTRLLLNIECPEMPWWAEALIVPMNTRAQHLNVSAMLTPRIWKKIAGKRCSMPAFIPAAASDSILGFVLLAAWSTAGNTSSNFNPDKSTEVSPVRAEYAGEIAANILEWAGLDKAAGRRCMAQALAAMGASPCSDTLVTRLRIATHAMLLEALSSDTETEMLGPASIGHVLAAASGNLAGLVEPACADHVTQWMKGAGVFMTQPPAAPEAALSVGLAVLAAAHVPSKAPADATTYDARTRCLAESLVALAQAGTCVDPGLLAKSVAEAPATCMLAASNALAFSAPASSPSKKRRLA